MRPPPALCQCWEKFTARAAKLASHPHWMEMENAHKLRIACRRARYLAEFFATSIAGRKARQAWIQTARRYQAAQDALGRTHDADVLLEFLRTSNLRPPTAVLTALEARRAAGLASFSRAWKKMEG